MKFGVFLLKIILRQFLSILTPLPLTIVNFGQNASLRAEKLSTSLFLYGESEKIGPETICRPPRFQVLRILLRLSLKIWCSYPINRVFDLCFDLFTYGQIAIFGIMVKKERVIRRIFVTFFLDELESYFNSLILDKRLIYKNCIQFLYE